MDRDTDLFVQAFWVKCREVIRPELERVVHELKSAGHDANVSTQEYSPVADHLPDTGPLVTLAVHPRAPAQSIPLEFHGDVQGQRRNARRGARRIAMNSPLGEPVKAEIDDWRAVALNHHPRAYWRNNHGRRHRRPVPPLRQGLQQGRCRGDRGLRDRRFRMAAECRAARQPAGSSRARTICVPFRRQERRAHREARFSEARIHRAGDKLFGTFRVTGIDHAGKPFDRYGIDLYELKDGKIALKDSYLKAD